MADRRRGRRSFGALVHYNDISTFIAAQNPIHWWKHDEVSGTLADSGTTARDMGITGTVTYQAGGPDAATDGVDFGGASNRGTNASALAGGSTGTVIVFWNANLATSTLATFVGVDSANEVNHMSIGIGGAGFGTASRVSVQFVQSLFSYRVIEGGTAIPSADSAWHSLVIVQNGTAPAIYYDGALETNNVIVQDAGGAPPSNAGWWTNEISPTRSFLANARFASNSAEFAGIQSSIAVLSKQLTAAEVARLHGFITN